MMNLGNLRKGTRTIAALALIAEQGKATTRELENRVGIPKGNASAQLAVLVNNDVLTVRKQRVTTASGVKPMNVYQFSSNDALEAFRASQAPKPKPEPKPRVKNAKPAHKAPVPMRSLAGNDLDEECFPRPRFGIDSSGQLVIHSHLDPLVLTPEETIALANKLRKFAQ